MSATTDPATPRAKEKHERTAEVHVPLHEATDKNGGTYYIARPMQGSLLEVNLSDMVILVFTGKVTTDGKKVAPELVLRMRDDLEY